MIPLTLLLCCVAAFLIGGIPFGYMVGRFVLKDDIRKHGSGNIGATNVVRVVGWKWGALVLLLDATKGAVPTLLTRYLAERFLGDSAAPHVTIAAGVCAIVGHMYPVWLRLRGGKGIATGLGVILVIAPVPTAIAASVFIVAAVASRIIGLGSMLAALTYGIAQLWMLGTDAWTWQNSSLTAFSTLVPALILWRHRSNLIRLFQGKELRITKTPLAAATEEPTTPASSAGQ